MQKSDRGMQSWAGISDTKSDGGKAARRLEGQQAFLYLSSTIPHLPFFFTYILLVCFGMLLMIDVLFIRKFSRQQVGVRMKYI